MGKSQGALAICLKQLGAIQKDSFGGINSDTMKRDCVHSCAKKNHESIPLSLTEIFASLFHNLCCQSIKKKTLHLFQSEKF